MDPVAQQPAQQPAAQPKIAFPEPNFFELKHRDVAVTFNTTTTTGEPLFHYHDRHRDVTAHGSQIQQVQTEIGTLVSITLAMGVDTGSFVFTLLVPRVHLAAPQEPISTFGIYTRNRFALLPSPGQVQTYEVVKLRGTARRVLP